MSAVRLLFSTLVWLAPRVAGACPSCATRTEGSGIPTGVVLGAFILLPFFVFAIVYRLIRHMETTE